MRLTQVRSDTLASKAMNEVDPAILAFTVTNPIRIGDKVTGHVKYKVTGSIMGNKFEILRRFKEFSILSKTMRTRWPGIIVPSLYEKKAY